MQVVERGKNTVSVSTISRSFDKKNSKHRYIWYALWVSTDTNNTLKKLPILLLLCHKDMLHGNTYDMTGKFLTYQTLTFLFPFIIYSHACKSIFWSVFLFSWLCLCHWFRLSALILFEGLPIDGCENLKKIIRVISVILCHIIIYCCMLRLQHL